MTPADIISEVRLLINDTDSAKYRYADSALLKFVNDAVTRIAILRPDLFATIAEVVCTVDEVRQSAPADCLRIIEVFRVKNGPALFESEREVHDQRDPLWVSATSAVATTWMRHARVPRTFFISPPAVSGQILIVEYAQMPPAYALSDTISLVDGYRGPLTDITVSLVQSIDNDHVSSGRAALFYKQGQDLLGVMQKTITDVES